MRKTLRQIRLRMFGAASNEDIKQFCFGMIFVIIVFAGLYLGLQLISILQGH